MAAINEIKSIMAAASGGASAAAAKGISNKGVGSLMHRQRRQRRENGEN